MMNTLMFFTSGVYYISIDFTYTQHMVPSFDNKCHDFMLLFIFTMFSYTYELYAKVSDLDHTGGGFAKRTANKKAGERRLGKLYFL